MSTTTILPPTMLRVSSVVYALAQKFLMVAGLVFVVGLIGIQAGHAGLTDWLKSLVSTPEAAVAEEGVSETPVEEANVSLNPRMRGALDYVSRRYHVSTDALQPIFATAQAVGRDLHIDPLLIIAVIGVESGFNPFSQSVVGAQELMQVMPGIHKDKLPDEADQLAFLDPVTNVQVGARVLKESIRRNGGIEGGLQQFAGAANDPDRRYASKVLAEKQRMEQAALRLRAS